MGSAKRKKARKTKVLCVKKKKKKKMALSCVQMNEKNMKKCEKKKIKLKKKTMVPITLARVMPDLLTAVSSAWKGCLSLKS